MNLTPDELETLMIGATRYALGRMTYVVKDTCDLLIRFWPELPHRARYVIARDVDEAFERHERGTGSLGWEIDVRQWERVRALWREGQGDV